MPEEFLAALALKPPDYQAAVLAALCLGTSAHLRVSLFLDRHQQEVARAHVRV